MALGHTREAANSVELNRVAAQDLQAWTGVRGNAERDRADNIIEGTEGAKQAPRVNEFSSDTAQNTGI
jgi:hypothetical protein